MIRLGGELAFYRWSRLDVKGLKVFDPNRRCPNKWWKVVQVDWNWNCDALPRFAIPELEKNLKEQSRSPGGTNCSANAKHVPLLAADHKSCIHLCHLRHNATPFNWKFRSLRDVTNLRSVPVLLYNLHFRTTFAMQLQLPQSLTFVHPVLRKSALTPWRFCRNATQTCAKRPCYATVLDHLHSWYCLHRWKWWNWWNCFSHCLFSQYWLHRGQLHRLHRLDSCHWLHWLCCDCYHWYRRCSYTWFFQCPSVMQGWSRMTIYFNVKTEWYWLRGTSPTFDLRAYTGHWTFSPNTLPGNPSFPQKQPWSRVTQVLCSQASWLGERGRRPTGGRLIGSIKTTNKAIAIVSDIIPSIFHLNVTWGLRKTATFWGFRIEAQNMIPHSIQQSACEWWPSGNQVGRGLRARRSKEWWMSVRSVHENAGSSNPAWHAGSDRFAKLRHLLLCTRQPVKATFTVWSPFAFWNFLEESFILLLPMPHTWFENSRGLNGPSPVKLFCILVRFSLASSRPSSPPFPTYNIALWCVLHQILVSPLQATANAKRVWSSRSTALNQEALLLSQEHRGYETPHTSSDGKWWSNCLTSIFTWPALHHPLLRKRPHRSAPLSASGLT